MNMESILDEWHKDSPIDETELAKESSNIPRLHAKWLRIFIAEKAVWRKKQAELFKAKKTITEFYNGELDVDELKTLGRDQFYKKMKTKEEMQLYLDSDDLIVGKRASRDAQSDKVDYVERVLKDINNRNWTIKTMLEWNRFTSGM